MGGVRTSGERSAYSPQIRALVTEGKKNLAVVETGCQFWQAKVFGNQARTSDPGSRRLAGHPRREILHRGQGYAETAGDLTGQLVTDEESAKPLLPTSGAFRPIGTDEEFSKTRCPRHVLPGQCQGRSFSSVAMAAALASMVSGRAVDAAAAMTGEVTLTGQVLPVGGIKEKVLAARAAGITQVFLPDRNEADVAEIRGEDLLKGLDFVYVDHVNTVLDRVLASYKKPRARRKSTGDSRLVARGDCPAANHPAAES